jgi:hypothetical protein
MWPWQVHFMISCKVAAESLFKKIDSRLQPTSFLLGFRTESDIEKPPICYEPEKMQFLAKDFEGIDEALREVYESDPLKDMFYSGLSREETESRTFRRNFPQAIKRILDNSPSFTDKAHFVGQAIKKNGYFVHVVLQLNKSIYSNYQFLKYRDPEEFLKKSMSFLDSAIDAYLEDHTYRLYPPDAGNERGPERDADELLRAAAKNFSFTIATAAGGRGFYEIYPACEALSVLKYEGKENQGHLIVCRGNHSDLQMTVEFADVFPITEYRKIRKVLELTNSEVGVITDSEQVLGLGFITPNYSGQKEDIFHIHFTGLHCYNILHQDQSVLVMRYGNPVQVRSVILPEKFAEDAGRVFSGITKVQIDYLYTLALSAAQVAQGSMLVFAPDAAQEAKRLAKQCIPIKPTKLDAGSLQALISIDGALIIDLDGSLHAKGAILDGLVGIDGDASRGSRYNSALTYQEFRGRKRPTLIVVVSEDGMVDTLPYLLPAIRHSEIIQFIKTLQSLNSQESFNGGTYYNTMDLLSSRAFYLSPDECDQMNQLNKSLEALDQKSGKTVWRKFDDFVPNPRMNETYYLPES